MKEKIVRKKKEKESGLDEKTQLIDDKNKINITKAVKELKTNIHINKTFLNKNRAKRKNETKSFVPNYGDIKIVMVFWFNYSRKTRKPNSFKN